MKAIPVVTCRGFFACLDCWSSILVDMSGKRPSKRDRMRRPISKVDGGTPVVDWGVRRYVKRNFDSLSWMVTPSDLV